MAHLKAQMGRLRPGPAKEGLKRRALAALRRRRAYERQREQLAAQGFNLDQTAHAAAALKDTAASVEAMRAASAAMKTQLAAVSVDDVYDMGDDMQELMDQHWEIQEAMARTYETPDGYDEEALEAELDALEDYISDEEAPAWLTELPDPATAPPSQTAAAQAEAPMMN